MIALQFDKYLKTTTAMTSDNIATIGTTAITTTIISDDNESNDSHKAILHLKPLPSFMQYDINEDRIASSKYFDGFSNYKNNIVLPIEEDNKELKRLIEQNYIYFRKQIDGTGDNESSSNSINKFKISALSESDFIAMKDNQKTTSKDDIQIVEKNRKLFALSDSEFLLSIAGKTKKLTLKSEQGSKGVLKTLLQKTRKSNDYLSLERNDCSPKSHEDDGSRTKSIIFRRSKNRKLSRSYNGVGTITRNRHKSENGSNDFDSVINLPRMLSEGHETDSNNYTGQLLRAHYSQQQQQQLQQQKTPDILLDLHDLNENIAPINSKEIQNRSDSCELINFDAEIIQKTCNDLSPTCDISGSGQLIEINENELLCDNKDNHLVNSNLDELLMGSSMKLDIPSESLIKQSSGSDSLINTRFSSVSDQVFVTSSKFVISPPTTPSSGNFLSPTSALHMNSQNVYYLTAPNVNNSTQQQIFSDSSTISLDVVTRSSPTQNLSSISPKPEIILDSTLSPSSLKNINTSIETEKEQSSSSTKQSDNNNYGGNLSITETFSSTINRKRQASVVTYDVNVINFTQDGNDGKNYVAMGRPSTSSASKYINILCIFCVYFVSISLYIHIHIHI